MYPAGFLDGVWKADMPAKEQKGLEFILDVDSKVYRLIWGPNDFFTLVPADDRKDAHKLQTKMRDFEVIDPFSTKEYRVKMGAGIGVIIIECHASYVKLIRDDSKRNVIHVIYTKWDHSDDAKQVLDSDLNIGYHVMYRAGSWSDGKWHSLVHAREQKAYEGAPFAPGITSASILYRAALVNVRERNRSRSPTKKSSRDRSRSRSRSPPNTTTTTAAAVATAAAVPATAAATTVPVCSTKDCKQKVQDNYDVKEWLHLGNECELCHKVFCQTCMSACYTCHNEGCGREFCKACAAKHGVGVISNVNCTVGHAWKVCKRHADSSCGECHANENFHGKMGC